MTDPVIHGFENVSWLLRDEVVYALYLDDVCQYVGRSRQVQIRLAQHRSQKRIPFNKCYVLTIPYDSRAEVEELKMIQLFEPPYNVTGNAGNGTKKRMTQSHIAAQANALLVVAGLRIDRRF